MVTSPPFLTRVAASGRARFVADGPFLRRSRSIDGIDRRLERRYCKMDERPICRDCRPR